jgi:hypothetical protein
MGDRTIVSEEARGNTRRRMAGECIAICRLLMERRRISVADLAKECDISRSSAYRWLTALSASWPIYYEGGMVIVEKARNIFFRLVYFFSCATMGPNRVPYFAPRRRPNPSGASSNRKTFHRRGAEDAEKSMTRLKSSKIFAFCLNGISLRLCGESSLNPSLTEMIR